MLANVRAVLGPWVVLWCWPQRMRGDGLSFAVGKGVGKWEESDSELLGEEAAEGRSGDREEVGLEERRRRRREENVSDEV